MLVNSLDELDAMIASAPPSDDAPEAPKNRHGRRLQLHQLRCANIISYWLAPL